MSTAIIWMCGIITACLLLVAGCDDQGGIQPQDSVGLGDMEQGAKGQAQSACTVDSDCMRAGCSGTVCQARNAEVMITTCEWREEYACFRDISCGCVKGQCAWQTSAEFEACLEEKRQAD